MPSDEKIISVQCQGAGVIELDDLLALQGELKTLAEEDATKLENEIIKTGFAFPFQLWREPGKTGERERYVIDGHQRLAVLKAMREKGWTVPPLPFVWVDAETKRDALLRVLQSSSQYGKMTVDSLRPFIEEANITIDEVAGRWRLPDIPTFNFYSQSYDETGGVKSGIAREIEQSEFSKFDHKCPRCGFEYDDDDKNDGEA